MFCLSKMLSKQLSTSQNNCKKYTYFFTETLKRSNIFQKNRKKEIFDDSKCSLFFTKYKYCIRNQTARSQWDCGWKKYENR